MADEPELLRAEFDRLDRSSQDRRVIADWVRDIGRDARYAARSLARSPSHTLAVVATLALGIGANTAMYSVADALLFRPPPYPRPSELVSVWRNMSGGELAILRGGLRTMAVAGYAEWQMNVGDEAATVRAEGVDVTENFFATLGVAPAIGRTFSPGANRPGATREAILSDGFWHTRFGGDRGVVGKSIFVEGIPRTVVGVMPATFHFPSLVTDIWIQSTFDPSDVGSYWGWWKYRALGRLHPGVTLSAAQRDLRAVAIGTRRENPLWDPGPTYGQDATLTPLQAELAGPSRTTVLVLLAVVFALLLIACANVANLVMVRAIGRGREFSVRIALGCGVARLTRQLLTESLVLSAAGGAAGAALAWAGVRASLSALPPAISRTAPVAVDGRVLLYTAVLTIASGIAFGLLPAFRATRRGPDLAHATDRSASRGVDHHRLAGVLTAAELALAVMLVAGAGLLLRSFDALRRVDPGFGAGRVLAARVTLSMGAYREPARRQAFLDGVLREVAGTAGIVSAGAVDRPPLRGPVYGTALRVEGQYEDLKRALPTIEHEQRITPDYLETMGIRLERGRDFAATDGAKATPVAIVSAAVARRFWPGADPIGRRIGAPYESPWITVVGVASDVQQDSLNGTDEMTLYRPLAQDPQTDVTIVVRTALAPASFASALREAVAGEDRSAPITDVRSMAEVVGASLARARFTAILLAGFAGLALALGAVGTYGVVSFSVAQRTRELGVRMALGATPSAVLGDVLRRGLTVGAAGIAIGLTGAFGLTRLLTGLLYGVSATDLFTFAVAPVLLFLVALGATWLPARRALRADPLVALRSD